MTELKPQLWETFRDVSYYDLWCVRQVGQRKFGEGYHVQSEEEARHLCATLNEYTAPRATGEDGELVARLRDSCVYNEQHYVPDPLVEEAADRITALSAEVERLTEALDDARVEAREEALFAVREYAERNDC